MGDSNIVSILITALRTGTLVYRELVLWGALLYAIKPHKCTTVGPRARDKTTILVPNVYGLCLAEDNPTGYRLFIVVEYNKYTRSLEHAISEQSKAACNENS
jgi:hypothetical protein